MPWNVKNLIKDILAMSNVRDGGVILIGVDDKSFARIGVSDEIADTYDSDVMHDQVGIYADPFVEFSVSSVFDEVNLRYIAIQVRSFRLQPVICKKEGDEVKRGGIYYRTRNRRPESALVASSSDMREILDTAVSKLHQYYQEAHLLADAGNAGSRAQEHVRRFDAELGDL